MKKEEFFELHLGKHLFPVKLVHEHRPNGRVSLATKEIIIRIPSSVPFEERKRIFEWAKDSIKQMYETKPEAFEKYIPVDYGKKSVITTYRDEIELKLKPQSAPPRFSAVLNENCLEITMPHDCPTNDPMLGDIVANILKKRYLPKVTLRLLNLNGEYFQVPMNKVKMRNNSTRWGSCSSGKNITISTRQRLYLNIFSSMNFAT
ncbi:MAG: DUF45 domain-containing protein [Bacteroidetes bacterium]|jgi:predicted metal-dependent hydrolase|nr:DUF45 domain-containing protein [Bacteroidota bacterium]